MTTGPRKFKMEFDFPKDFDDDEKIDGLVVFAFRQVIEQTEYGRRLSGQLYCREGILYGRWTAF